MSSDLQPAIGRDRSRRQTVVFTCLSTPDAVRNEEVLNALMSSTLFRRCCRDDGPTWLEGRVNPKQNPSVADAEAAQRRLIKVLRRHGAHLPEAMRLANALEEDAKSDLASSGFVRNLQRFWVKTQRHALSRLGGEWSVVSLVHKDVGAYPGRITPAIFERLRARAIEAFRAAGITYAIGGFDLSANEHERSDFRDHYRPELFCFVPTTQILGGARVVRDHFPRGQIVPRPVVVRPFDGRTAALAYACKREFERRIVLGDTDASGRNTRKKGLLAAQKVEIALAMTRTPPLSRLFLYGLTLTINGNREVAIRPSRDRKHGKR